MSPIVTKLYFPTNLAHGLNIAVAGNYYQLDIL